MLSRMLAELAREHAPEATFSPPLQVGEHTVICASSVSCLAGSRGPNMVMSLRSSPCAVIVIRPGHCTVLPLGASATVDRLLELAPRLLALLEGEARDTAPGSPAEHEGTRSAGDPADDEARPRAGPPATISDQPG
ncbi:MAG: hypothetical protein AB1503_03355 [Bacillota bacterium]|nr:hypothetical protein [Bacillota bacterium]